MPILHNARHERFAQEVAAGQTVDKAYETAGFKRDRRNAGRLREADDIRQRIGELLADRDRAQQKTQAIACKQAAVSRADVLRMLVEDREMARAKNQLGPAVRATELLGKELGMFIDRSLRKETDDIFEGLSDEDLRRMVSERARALADDSKETRH